LISGCDNINFIGNNFRLSFHKYTLVPLRINPNVDSLLIMHIILIVKLCLRGFANRLLIMIISTIFSCWRNINMDGRLWLSGKDLLLCVLAPILASHECQAQHTEEVNFGLKIKRVGILFSTARIHRWSRSTVIR